TPATDPTNGGGWGKACPPIAHGSPGCKMSACGVGACTGAFADCNGLAADGCEIDTGSDPANCGGCGKGCSMVKNGSPGCAMGVCGVGGCNAPFKDCNGVAAD